MDCTICRSKRSPLTGSKILSWMPSRLAKGIPVRTLKLDAAKQLQLRFNPLAVLSDIYSGHYIFVATG
eukprot:12708373-Prorocentrum_lima.AAC.1